MRLSMNLTDEVCINAGEYSQCAGPEVLLIALALECSFYILVFAGGLRLLEHFREKQREKQRQKRRK